MAVLSILGQDLVKIRRFVERTFIVGVSSLALFGCDYLLEPIEELPPPPKPAPPVLPIPTSDNSQDEVIDIDVETDEDIDSEPTLDESDNDDSAPDTEPEVPPSEPEPTSPPEPEPEPVEPTFNYFPPGDLEPRSGQGATDPTVYVPDMVFPIKNAPAFPQSQVYRFGGGIGGGDQCDPRNFAAAWRDNYCESRTRKTTSPYCPSQGVHVGQDIRVGTPEGCNAERRLSSEQRKRYEVVAAEDGYISNIGRYTVNVRAGGRIYRYMHMNMRALQVALGQEVEAGDTLGYVSNDFGGTPTTLHLHFEIKHNTAEHGWTWAPPFTSLVKAYERRENAPGQMVIAE